MKFHRFFQNRSIKVLGTLLLAIVFFIVHYQTNRHEKLGSAFSFDKNSFESVLHQHQRTISNTLYALVGQASKSTGSYDSCFQQSSLFDCSFYVFCNDSLVAWNNALIPIDSLKAQTLNKPVSLFPNGWYLIQSHRRDSISAYGLMRIRSGYVFENEYLFNSFHPCFHLSSVPEIVTTPIDSRFNIHDREGHYLFSLRFNGLKPQWSNTTTVNGLSFLLFIISLMTFGRRIIKYYVMPISKEYALLLAMLLLCMIYFSMLFIRFSPALLSCPLFSSSVYALAWWLPSLGFFVLLAFFVFIWSLWYYRIFDELLIFNISFKSTTVSLKPLFYMLVSGIYFVLINLSLILLVEHSNDLTFFVEPVDISVVSISKIVIIFLFLISFIIISERLLSELQTKSELKNLFIVLGIFVVVAAIVSFFMARPFVLISSVVFSSYHLLLAFLKNRNKGGIGYAMMVGFAFLFSLFFVLRISYLTDLKEKRNRALLIQNLSFRLMREDDPVAEMFLQQIEKNIRTDKFLQFHLSTELFNSPIITEYLRKNYFEGYFSRYDLQVIPCSYNSELLITGSNDTYNCYRYFYSMLAVFGARIAPASSFYFLKDGDGRSSYFGDFNYVDSVSGHSSRLFIEINSKPYFVGLGYPELLTNKGDRLNIEQYEGYSYAKYVDGKLVARFGDYNYHLSSQWIGARGKQNFSFFESDGYSHLLFQSGNNQFVVLSYPLLSLKNVLVNFSFIFLIILILSSILLLVVTPHRQKIFHSQSIQERIRFSFVALLIFLLITMCVVSVIYSFREFEAKNRMMMSQKLRSVLVDLQHSIGHEEKLTASYTDHLNQLLQKSANVFFTDVNFYGTDGHLLGTSRSELYSKGIVAPIINHKAYYSMAIKEDPEFMTNEQIGDLKYLSGYMPFYNYENQLLGYLNIPYFVGINSLHQQLSSIIVAIINAYLFFILIAVGLAIFISRRIAAPLLAIRESIKNVQLGKSNAKINYAGTDEIGNLITEYNRMLDELAFSAEKLATSERDSAWREMAKQIAHEINNPLTPMKLSVQYLQKAWVEQREDYPKYMNRVTNTLIEQIDQLSIIASEFSNFAKMPAMNPERIDVVNKISNAISLFEKTENIRFTFNGNGIEQAFIYADGEQMGSVLNNLIKNAIQAIDAKRMGEIIVSLNKTPNEILISVTDNGHGIPADIQEKMFKPNFTTKSTGMGLGLAIVKNIIIGMQGSIWFETSVGVGTTFHVSIPLHKMVPA